MEEKNEELCCAAQPLLSKKGEQQEEEEAAAAAAARRRRRREKKEEEEEEAALVRVDWLGRPASPRLGGWTAASFLLGSQCLQSLALSGCVVNLVIFLVREMQQDNASAANAVTNWVGTTFITSILGGALGDAYLGRLWTSLVYQLLFVLGLVMFSLLGTIIVAQARPSSFHVVLFYIALYIMGLGTASLAPNMLSLGADQFDSPKQKSAFISLIMASSSVGMLISTSVLSYVENEGQWEVGFWLSAGIGILGFLLFLAGMPSVRQLKPGKNPLFCIACVVIAAVRNRKSNVIEPSLKGVHGLQRAPSFRWLDKAAVSNVDSYRSDHLQCTMDQVEEVRSVCQLLPFWVCSILVASAMAQKSTLFVLQGDTMDNRVWGKLKFPSSSMGLFSMAMVIMGAPAYTLVIEPCVLGHKSFLGRMGAGLVVAIAMFCTAAVMEAQRLRIYNERVGGKEGSEMVPMSIFWLVPQYVLEGLSTVLFTCGNLDFNYSYSPRGMRSLATAIGLSALALGNYLSSFIVEIVTSFTSWITDDLNQGHLDYFYWLLVGLLLVTFALFVVSCKWVLSSQSLHLEHHPILDEENASATPAS